MVKEIFVVTIREELSWQTHSEEDELHFIRSHFTCDFSSWLWGILGSGVYNACGSHVKVMFYTCHPRKGAKMVTWYFGWAIPSPCVVISVQREEKYCTRVHKLHVSRESYCMVCMQGFPVPSLNVKVFLVHVWKKIVLVKVLLNWFTNNIVGFFQSI